MALRVHLSPPPVLRVEPSMRRLAQATVAGRSSSITPLRVAREAGAALLIGGSRPRLEVVYAAGVTAPDARCVSHPQRGAWTAESGDQGLYRACLFGSDGTSRHTATTPSSSGFPSATIPSGPSATAEREDGVGSCSHVLPSRLSQV